MCQDISSGINDILQVMENDNVNWNVVGDGNRSCELTWVMRGIYIRVGPPKKDF